ncbi:MAG: putative manganese-dependent inorganic diphosphatase [Treponema sp.]|nr:putative manganese-dependent inorganic diphosphatase [Treponema sp.]
MNKTVYIFGHKNPDTDSIVSATAYARLKQLQGFDNFKAARAGHFNPQTDYVYKKFNVESPKYLSNLTPKVEYFMQDKCETVEEGESVWAALAKMQTHNLRALPVVDSSGHYKALLHYSAFAQKLLLLLNPELKTNISTSINLIIKTMNAQPLVVHNQDDIFKASILAGGASDETFKTMIEEKASENLIVITSDREKIYELCIEHKIKLLIITSGFMLSKELKEKAKKNGVSVIMSPYTTSDTVMMIAYSTPVSIMADPEIPAVQPGDTISKIRTILLESPIRRLPVVDSNNVVIGIISEHDLTNEPNIRLILVDHNELTQAVEGVEHYKIQEIIDHHRIGSFSTPYPITFINKPIGSTSTIITTLYQEAKIPIPKEIACLLLCGILSDTLILKSTTTTDIDRQTAEYLSNITDLDIETIGREILTAGSIIKGRSATEVIHQDMKEYKEAKISYTVSQIEVGNLKEIMDRKKEFLEELEIERRANKGLFAALLVTDITQLSSILLIEYDPKFESFITFQKQEKNVYFLKDVVSRKKQLIPLITEQVENFER